MDKVSYLGNHIVSDRAHDFVFHGGENGRETAEIASSRARWPVGDFLVLFLGRLGREVDNIRGRSIKGSKLFACQQGPRLCRLQRSIGIGRKKAAHHGLQTATQSTSPRAKQETLLPTSSCPTLDSSFCAPTTTSTNIDTCRRETGALCSHMLVDQT
jgi:hypothetical protein